MGQQKSHYYFVGELLEKEEREIPVFGFHTGKPPSMDWDSAKALNKDDFKDLLIVINPQVSVFFAVPQKTAKKVFPAKGKLKKVVLNAWKVAPKPAYGDGYMEGPSVLIKFSNVMVQDHFIPSSFPHTGDVQRARVEKSMGRDAHFVVAVKLFVQGANLIE